MSANVIVEFDCDLMTCRLLILWRAQKDSNLRPIDS